MKIVRLALIGLLLVGVLLAIAWFFRHGKFSRTVARAVTPDGTEMRLIQEQKWSDLPWLQTSFYYRKPGGVWKWCYYHHEDHLWFSCSVSLDTNAKVAIFTREKSRGSIRFDWDKEKYMMVNRPERSVEPNPMPPDWSP